MKYNIESAKRMFEDFGYILDTDEYISCDTKMSCHDKDGFRYELNINSIRTGRHPYKYHSGNKYTLSNIQLVLDRETDGVIVLENEYINSRKKMKFKCSCGNYFDMNISSFVGENKRYCNHCAKSKRYDGLRDYTQLINNECKRRKYKLVTRNINRSTDEFQYVCLKHLNKGVQISTYDRMVSSGSGCIYCGIESRGVKHRIPKEELIRLLNEKGFEYISHDYVRYSNGSKKVRICCICNKHREKGTQYLDYGNLKNNTSGCIYCIGRGRTKESLQSEFDSINAKIDIIEFEKYSDITLQCRLCGNIWRSTGINILSGHGCPKCSKSNYEKTIEDILVKNNINYFSQYRFSDCKDRLTLPFDFYISDTNTLIEVDGQGHYKPVNFRGMSDEEAIESYRMTIRHDKIKTDYCREHDIKLLRVPYYVIDDKDVDTERYLLDNI